jgi:uncharacterized protein YciI
MNYLLFYDYVPDMLARRDPVRPAHLAHARAALDAGLLRMAGAYADTVDGAVFVFTADSPAPIETFVANDPYVTAGLVTAHRIRPWNVVIGA